MIYIITKHFVEDNKTEVLSVEGSEMAAKEVVLTHLATYDESYNNQAINDNTYKVYKESGWFVGNGQTFIITICEYNNY